MTVTELSSNYEVPGWQVLLSHGRRWLREKHSVRSSRLRAYLTAYVHTSPGADLTARTPYCVHTLPHAHLTSCTPHCVHTSPRHTSPHHAHLTTCTPHCVHASLRARLTACTPHSVHTSLRAGVQVIMQDSAGHFLYNLQERKSNTLPN